jgi:hypothetical protein
MELKQNQQIMKNQLRLRNQNRLHRNERGYGPFQRENSESRPTGGIKL